LLYLCVQWMKEKKNVFCFVLCLEDRILINKTNGRK